MKYVYNNRSDVDKYSQELNKWIEGMDFAAMLTVKYYTIKNEHDCINSFNRLMANINKMVYGRDYTKKGHFIDGIVSFEKNKGKSISKFHNHLLIKNGEWNKKFKNDQLFDIILNSSTKIEDINGRRIFNYTSPVLDIIESEGLSAIDASCFNFVTVYSKGVVGYVTKEFSSNNHNIKYLCINGLSDNCTDFIKQ